MIVNNHNEICLILQLLISFIKWIIILYKFVKHFVILRSLYYQNVERKSELITVYRVVDVPTLEAFITSPIKCTFIVLVTRAAISASRKSQLFLFFSTRLPGDPINYPYETLKTVENAIYPVGHQRDGKDENTCCNIRHVYFDKEHYHLPLLKLYLTKSDNRLFYIDCICFHFLIREGKASSYLFNPC